MAERKKKTAKKKASKKKAPKKRQGRKFSLTPEVKESFLKAIRLGCPIKDACGCAGISLTTYNRWMFTAENDGICPDMKKAIPSENLEKIRDFRSSIKEVEGEATRTWLAIIEKAARDGTWQAAAWKLERRRDMFIPRVRQEVTGKDGEAIRIESESSQALDVIESGIARVLAARGTVGDSGEADPGTTH